MTGKGKDYAKALRKNRSAPLASAPGAWGKSGLERRLASPEEARSNGALRNTGGIESCSRSCPHPRTAAFRPKAADACPSPLVSAGGKRIPGWECPPVPCRTGLSSAAVLSAGPQAVEPKSIRRCTQRSHQSYPRTPFTRGPHEAPWGCGGPVCGSSVCASPRRKMGVEGPT